MALLAVVIGCQDPLGYTGDDVAECPGCFPPPGGNVLDKCTANNADLAAESATLRISNPNLFIWTLRIRNVGTDIANLSLNNSVTVQGWLSKDGVNRFAGACGQAHTDPIAPGDFAEVVQRCNLPIDKVFKFLIIDIQWNPTIECPTGNNTIVIPIEN